jgi:phosphohistidine phosphatase
MKKLYLIRHAKSSWEDSSLDDIDRPLNNRGKNNAPEMGERLRKQGILPDLLISSPAKRALSTAKKIANKIGYSKNEILIDENLYHGSDDMLIEIVKQLPDTAESVMLFGHNPGFTYFANQLCDINIYNIPTAGIVAIDFQIDKWQDSGLGMGDLVFFDYPKKKPNQ